MICAHSLALSACPSVPGPDEDWGIKFNFSSGQPAPETITDKIYANTQTIKEIKIAEFPDIDLAVLGEKKFGDFSVEVVDSVADYLELLKEIFDFDAIKALINRKDFGFR